MVRALAIVTSLCVSVSGCKQTTQNEAGGGAATQGQATPQGLTAAATPKEGAHRPASDPAPGAEGTAAQGPRSEGQVPGVAEYGLGSVGLQNVVGGVATQVSTPTAPQPAPAPPAQPPAATPAPAPEAPPTTAPPAESGAGLAELRRVADTVCECPDMACGMQALLGAQALRIAPSDADVAGEVRARMQECARRLSESASQANVPAPPRPTPTPAIAPPSTVPQPADARPTNANAGSAWVRGMNELADRVCACRDSVCAGQTAAQGGQLHQRLGPPPASELQAISTASMRMQRCLMTLSLQGAYEQR